MKQFREVKCPPRCGQTCNGPITYLSGFNRQSLIPSSCGIPRIRNLVTSDVWRVSRETGLSLCHVPAVRRLAPAPSPSDRWAGGCTRSISTHVWSPEDTQRPKNASLHNSHSILHRSKDYCCEDEPYDNWTE